jgi:hypothetical protein
MPEPTEEDAVRTALREVLAEAGAARPPETAAELRARSGRRTIRLPDAKLLAAVAAAVVLVVALLTAGALHQSSRQPTPVHRSGWNAFSIRPLLCFAPPFRASTVTVPDGTALPPCSSASALTAANLGIEPDGSDPAGYTSNLPPTPADDSFATVPSTAGSHVMPTETVLLPGAPGTGATRYVLGPAGVTGVDVASATVHRLNGQWTVELTLTPTGSTAWDTLAEQQFHALVGIVLHGRVLSAPVIQPTQSAFTSFDGQLELSGAFTHSQATAAASAIVGSN